MTDYSLITFQPDHCGEGPEVTSSWTRQEEISSALRFNRWNRQTHAKTSEAQFYSLKLHDPFCYLAGDICKDISVINEHGIM